MLPTAQARNLLLQVCLIGTIVIVLVGSKAQADGPPVPATPPVKTAPPPRPRTPVPSLVPLLPPHVLIDTDFSAGMVPTQPQHGLNAWGNLAVPWRDTSGWGHVWVNYNIRDEGGQRFQRIAVSKLQDGRAQCVYLLPKLRSQTLQLHLKLRGTPGLSLFFGVRQQGFPWSYGWANVIVLTKQWRDLDWPVQLPDTMAPSLFIFEIPNNGQLDLAVCRLTEPDTGDFYR